MSSVVIIGGGCSGIVCAISLKKHHPDVEVTIVERLDRIGKKILATGNGKCNFTNSNLNRTKYNNPLFVNNFIKEFGYYKTIAFFEELGMYSKELNEGRNYPFSEQASTVIDVFRIALNSLKVNIRNNFEVEKVMLKNGKYRIYNRNQRNYYIECDSVVFACGGKSAEVLGSNGSGFNLLKSHKVKITPLSPGLVGLKTDSACIKAMNGLRVKAKVLLKDKKTKNIVYFNEGEIQFKEDGISGIVVMDSASFMARSKDNYIYCIDFNPNVSQEVININLKNRRKVFSEIPVTSFLTGMYPKLLNQVLIKECGVDLNIKCSEIPDNIIKKLSSLIKCYPVSIIGPYGFDKSQVTIGGVSLDEVDKKTLELKKMKNCYVCGELLDVDGDCGGYNLQWAITSGYLVGRNINV